MTTTTKKKTTNASFPECVEWWLLYETRCHCRVEVPLVPGACANRRGLDWHVECILVVVVVVAFRVVEFAASVLARVVKKKKKKKKKKKNESFSCSCGSLKTMVMVVEVWHPSFLDPVVVVVFVLAHVLLLVLVGVRRVWLLLQLQRFPEQTTIPRAKRNRTVRRVESQDGCDCALFVSLWLWLL